MTQLSKIKFWPLFTRIVKDDKARNLLADNLKNYTRDLEMSKMYIEWATLTEIANRYWITRERSRQIVDRCSQQQDKLVRMYKAISSF